MDLGFTQKSSLIIFFSLSRDGKMLLFKKTSLILLFIFSIIPKPIMANAENKIIMDATILGAIASLGLACYQGKDPCQISPNLNTDKLTLSLNQGGNNDTIQHSRLALGADWQEDIYDSKNFNISGRWEINANYWSSTKTNPQNASGYIVGLTPVFHYSWKKQPIIPYFELGGGPQYLSNATIENDFKSTQFQFGSILGIGIKNQYFELGYRYLHISNANISAPNPATDFHNLHIGYKF